MTVLGKDSRVVYCVFLHNFWIQSCPSFRLVNYDEKGQSAQLFNSYLGKKGFLLEINSCGNFNVLNWDYFKWCRNVKILINKYHISISYSQTKHRTDNEIWSLVVLIHLLTSNSRIVWNVILLTEGFGNN